MICNLWGMTLLHCRAPLMGLLISKCPEQVEITNYPGSNVSVLEFFKDCIIIHMRLDGCREQNLSYHVFP